METVEVIEPGYAKTKQIISHYGKKYYLGYINYGIQGIKEETCAVKIYQLESMQDNIDAEREKEVLMSLDHENIAKTYKIIQKDKQIYIFREYDAQMTLKTLIDRLEAAKQEIDCRLILSLGARMIDCLNYMESLSLTNRDLNPSNIFLNQEMNFKIFDFGQSKIIEKDEIGLTMGIGINDYFMSPQMLGLEEENGENIELNYYKSDIWSLGMILYYFGEYQYPWRRELKQSEMEFELEIQKMKDPNYKLQFRRITSPELKSLISRMLIYDQDRRASAKQLLEEPFIKPYVKQPSPQITKLQFLCELIQRLKDMKAAYDVDEVYQDLIFNLLIRYFTENKKLLNKRSKFYNSYRQLLDYQMFNKKQLWYIFKVNSQTKRQLKNYVNEYRRQSTLNHRQQEELMLLLQAMNSEKQYPNNPQQLIEEAEKYYLEN
ncbi:unnamed protein product [Paramecium octaurelia]|uniref:Protein kinase domain-containing protein n=1 Tax=Paramecium octaurelia TaxID=43137 RepID=A0A8S1UYP3_PAROT|nr:unnamed protein product [Paramecium octaurelia]